MSSLVYDPGCDAVAAACMAMSWAARLRTAEASIGGSEAGFNGLAGAL